MNATGWSASFGYCMKGALWGSAIAIGVLAGCADHSPIEEKDIATSAQPLISGDLDTTYQAVVNVGCTGILIGRRVVLSAGHCFAQNVTNCPAAPPINQVQFFGANGVGVAAVANSLDFRAQPQVDVGAGCSGLCANAINFVNRSADYTIIFIDRDPPAGVNPMPILVDRASLTPGRNHVARMDSFAGVFAWGATAPIVTQVGYGFGSQGRDIGVATWSLSQYDPQTGATCSSGSVSNPVQAIVTRATDVPATALPPRFRNPPAVTGPCVPPPIVPQPGAVRDWQCTPPGYDIPASVPGGAAPQQSMGGGGDSGGPVILGAGPGAKGLAPTPLPAPAPGDTYDPALAYVGGIAEFQTNATVTPMDTYFAPTFMPGNTAFLDQWLQDSDDDDIPDTWDRFPNCDDLGPDPDGDGTPTACGDLCPCSADEMNPSNPTLISGAASDGDGFCNVCSRFLSAECNTICSDPKNLDNCPSVFNDKQENCNSEAENRAGALVKLGDDCDPSPCAQSAAEAELLTLSIAVDSCKPNASPVDHRLCPVSIDTGIRWQGIAGPPRNGQTGETQFAHCVCKEQHDDERSRQLFCQTRAFGLVDVCPLGDSRAFPVAGGAARVSDWRAISTTSRPKCLDCIQVGSSSSPQRNRAFPATFQVADAPAQRTRWLFDADLGPDGFNIDPSVIPSRVQSQVDLIPLANELRGIGWAFTPRIGGTNLSTFDASLASYYFEQDLNPRPNSLLRIPIAAAPFLYRIPVEVPCIGHAATPECWFGLVAPWIFNTPDGGVHQIGVGVTQTITPFLAGGVQAILGNVGRTITFVEASEPSSLLSAYGIATRAVALDNATRTIVGTLEEKDGGLTISEPPGIFPCPEGQVAVHCTGGVLRCASACNGIIGDDHLRGIPGDSNCELEFSDFANDETFCSAGCGPGHLACASGCATPCNGTAECTFNFFGSSANDESSDFCAPLQSVNALSARRGELYDVGRDSAGREHLRILNLRTEAASDFVISGIDNHGIEKALTYRYRDDSLYLLDEAVVNGQQSLRLSRLSRAGVATLLHTIGFGGRSSVFLTGTYDGSLLLAASDSTKVDHAEYFILQPTSAGIEVLESFEDPEKGTLLKPPDALSRVAYAIARSSPKADEIELTEIPRSAFRPVPPGQRDKILRWLD